MWHKSLLCVKTKLKIRRIQSYLSIHLFTGETRTQSLNLLFLRWVKKRKSLFMLSGPLQFPFFPTTCRSFFKRNHILMYSLTISRVKSCSPLCMKPQHLLDVKSLKHLSNLTLHDRITKSLLHLHKKKKPPSISAQFQVQMYNFWINSLFLIIYSLCHNRRF